MADGGERSDNRQKARCNNDRYEYVRQRGHDRYCVQARRNQDMYLGGGKQWTEEDAAYLDAQGRKPIEMNEIFDAVNTALGHQISNRVDIAYRPRGMGADDDTATSMSKVAMQVCDNNDMQHVETDVFSDGMIEQRGYFEFTLDYDENLRGEIKFYHLDPMDVIPDPDAKGYDPDTWTDVIITRWYTLDQIEGYYGRGKRKQVESFLNGAGEEDFGETEIDGTERDKFGDHDMPGTRYDFSSQEDNGDYRVRVIDRQYWKVVNTKVAVFPTGDIRIMEDATSGQQQQAIRQGAMVFSRPMRRVRWCVSTFGEVLLWDKWSPFKHFTVVPFFPFFRRGQTRGMVDNMIGPQEMLNKSLSQYLHIVNTSANSGWIVQQNSLTNMSTDDLETEGARTGLVVEYKMGMQKPEKIQANSVPTGIDRLAEIASSKIRIVSGISDALRGQSKPAQSGLAVQSLQFGSQLSLAVPIDNLGRTRRMFALRLLEMIQAFMTEPQIMRITERDANGKEKSVELPINWETEDGSILNDLTLGEYDAVVTEQPSQVTFQNSQFQQAMQMLEKIPGFPPELVLRYSTLADKQEAIDALAEARGKSNPSEEAKALLSQAQAALAKAGATAKNIESLFSAMRTAALLRGDPALAGIADEIAKSGGFVDQNEAPIFNEAEAAIAPPGPAPPLSSNPLTPDNPTAGDTAGMTAVEGAA